MKVTTVVLEGGSMRNNFILFTLMLSFFVSSLVLGAFASEIPSTDTDVPLECGDVLISSYGDVVLNIDYHNEPSEGYMNYDDFMAQYGEDCSYSVIVVQSTPNSPVTSSSGLKGLLLKMFGPYDPVITQLRYQSNTSTNYTYVNDISPDYPWLCSAGIFAIVLFCTFKLGGTFLCKT